MLTAEAGDAVRLKFPLVGPARRVTLHDSETEAHTGLGGVVEPIRKFFIPVLIAFFIARGEVKRRRKAEQERLEAQRPEDDDDVTPRS